jgi:hypothetical protein
LLTVPEKDDWVYNDGQSASCVAYVLMMYKEAGLFDPLSSSIEVTEFTVSNAELVCLSSIFYEFIGGDDISATSPVKVLVLFSVKTCSLEGQPTSRMHCPFWQYQKI